VRDYSIYLQDIFSNIEHAEKFAANLSFDEFVKNYQVNYAVVRCLEIIGEACKQIPQTVRNKYPEIPWRRIIGTRNVIVHEYAAVDLEIIWGTVKNDLPVLKKQIQQIITDLTQ
jgi:uncharacterized protein with HEPN domain